MLRSLLQTRVSLSRFAGASRAFASSPKEAFEQAQVNLKKLSEEPDVDTKLQIYALYKQASSGDVAGSRPGMMDFAGRAKFDAWSKMKGIAKDDAMMKYASLVQSLSAAEPEATPSASVEGLTPVTGIDVSIDKKVFKIALNRPAKFNALTLDMYKGIIAALKASSDNKNTSVTVIHGTGNFFCSGNDLSNFAKAATATKEEIREMALEAGKVLEDYVKSYIEHKKPIIVVVNGPAIGIAVTVLPLCDYIIASDKATFNTPFAALGQAPEGCSSYTFPLLMGQMKASEVLLFGKKLTAHEAEVAGLVNDVVPEAELWQRAEKSIAQFSSLPPESLCLNKQLLRSVHKQQLLDANVAECRLLEDRWQSKECAQAIAAFLTRSKK